MRAFCNCACSAVCETDSLVPVCGDTTPGCLVGINLTPAFRWSPKKGDRIRKGYITPAFSGAQKWADWIHNPAFAGSPIGGDKFRRVYITPDFLGAVSLVRGGGVKTRHGWGTA